MAKTAFTSPVMRFVQGDVDTPNDKDMQGNLRVIKTGPNAGQPNPQYFVAGAIAKTDPAWPPMWEMMVRQAHADFPALFPHGVDAIIQAGGPQAWFTQIPQGHTQPWVLGEFSWKITDGDGSVFREGKMINHAEKPGFAGCWVLRFQSAFPPRCFHANRYAANEQIQEKNVIRRGYYIRIEATLEGNGNLSKPGLYVTPRMVELSGYGPEIVSGPDAGAAFGGGPVALPAGATAAPMTPAAPATGGAPVPPSVASPAGAPTVTPTPPVPGGAYVAPMSPSSPAPAPTPAPAHVQPYAGFMPAAGAPAAAPTPPTPAASPSPAPIASPSRVMLPAANGATYEQMIAAGWTDETMRASGMMQ